VDDDVDGVLRGLDWIPGNAEGIEALFVIPMLRKHILTTCWSRRVKIRTKYMTRISTNKKAPLLG
jgi:hypothetical protein